MYYITGLPLDEMVVLKPAIPGTPATPAGGGSRADRKSKDLSSKVKSNTTTAKVHTLKTTIGHNSTLESRDQAYNVSYMSMAYNEYVGFDPDDVFCLHILRL